MSHFFSNQISIIKHLEELNIGKPSLAVQNKTITELDEHCIDFIQKSPFVVLSTSNKAGKCDASPRGDERGFVLVLDNKHLVLPERPGNKRMDSIHNILSNPQIGLLFTIPGVEETLRIAGKAYIINDSKLLKKMAVNGRSPQLGIGVEVEECFIHCAKAFKRSKLWDCSSWIQEEERPNAAAILVDHIKMKELTLEIIKENLKESYLKRLY
ncbi:MSMEG_1061 family FMN-dependent PPOX-type flavoprotein [Alkalihalobacterium bogoriense]|uniref:MSMEG_1061 family FMN-dependent PPOX-type flavoprotein n=1 Tax=Alkalihalobacterium bogoriense TaxID=246272 RepID=UPI000479B6E2|nr:MSMEG_1061 family FMN-dependent PPOX-type flavoprotein [Alkalihalobacterium bogoriense]